MFKNFRINWKTSLAGLGGIATGIGLLIKGQIFEGVSSIITGAGLIGAKDFNVTGGTKEQPAK